MADPLGRLTVEGAWRASSLVRDAVYAWCRLAGLALDVAGVGSCSCLDTRDGFCVAFVFSLAIPSSSRRAVAIPLPNCTLANEPSSMVRSIWFSVAVLDEDASGVGTGGRALGSPAVGCEETETKLRDVSNASWTFGKKGPAGLDS